MMRQIRHTSDPQKQLTGQRGTQASTDSYHTSSGGASHGHGDVTREDQPKQSRPLKLKSESYSRSRAGSNFHIQPRHGMCKGMEMKKSLDKELKNNAGGSVSTQAGARRLQREAGWVTMTSGAGADIRGRERSQRPALTEALPLLVLFLLLRIICSGSSSQTPPAFSPRFQALYTCPSKLLELH